MAFSVAENLRQNRHVLRSHLRALGFAPFYDGLWIAAYADTHEVTRQLSEVPDADVAVFRATLANQSHVAFTKLFDTWKLDEVRAEYEDFISAFGPLKARVVEDSVAPAEAFVARTRLMDAWRVFPRIDPDLPDEILPADWPRSTARELCAAIYDALQPTADLRFLSLIAS